MTEKKERVDSYEFQIKVDRIHDYEFRVLWDKPFHPHLVMDEPPPTGADVGPSPTRVVTAAIANCLLSTLLFCLQRTKLEIKSLRAVATTKVVRNEEGRLRIKHMDVQIPVTFKEEEKQKGFHRCVDIFENFCTVTESVRHGIPVDVNVFEEKTN